MEKFHEKLKILRKKRGFTQQEVADLVHVDRVRITNWENGKREPNFENLSMLACIFDVSIDFLLSEYAEISKERYLKFKNEKKEEEEKQQVFSVRLKELRLKKGLTQTELGKKVGVKQSTFTNWEKGKREPNFETLLKLALILNATTSYLLGESDICYEHGSDVR